MMTTTTTTQPSAGASVGLKVWWAALFTIGAVFMGAHGLLFLSAIAMMAAVVAGAVAIVAGTRGREETGSVMVGIGASTLSVLAGVGTWMSSLQLPFVVVTIVALVPAVAWAGFWWAQRETGESLRAG